MRRDADTESDDPIRYGRGDMDEWKRLGYLSIEHSDPGGGPDRPGSRSMEYAANDYAIALLAKGLGHEVDAGQCRVRRSDGKIWLRGDNGGNAPEVHVTSVYVHRHRGR